MKNKNEYKIEKSFKANTKELPDVQEFVQNALQNYICDKKTIMQINLVIEELFVNIASYAYQNDEGTCNVSVDYDGEKEIMITIEDNGIPFNPLEKDDPDITLSADERKIGGLGIFITKQIMNHIEYQYKNKKNILKMKKLI